MKLRLCCLALCLALTLAACAGSADCTAVSEALDNAPAERTGKFVLNVRFGDELTTLLFSMGDYTADSSSLSAKLTQTVLGTASAVTLEYADGVCAVTTDGETTSSERAADELLTTLPYTRPFLPPDIADVKTSSDGSGTLYTVESRGDDSEKLFSLFGDGIYAMSLIKTPRKEKMHCENAVYTYRVSDGAVTYFGLSFTMYLYDTPPYVPGVAQNEDDYTLELFVDFNVTLG